jgi:peptide/nickel transport system substrate-binding protein
MPAESPSVEPNRTVTAHGSPLLALPRPAGKRALACVLLLGLATFGTSHIRAQAEEARHAIAMHGAPAMPEDFTRLPYANPNAPKGGRLLQGMLGTFDSLNPFIVKGIALQSVRGYVVESLMARGFDEPFTLYGLVARSVETDPQRSYVIFRLNPAARFSDGKPVTAEDVIFSWRLLRDKGRPNHRTYYAKVAKAEIVGEHGVRFDLSGSDDRELPLILGLMPVLAKHALAPDKFEETSFQAPLGSGPYVLGEVDSGKKRHSETEFRLLGARPSGQSRFLELRRNPLRLLSRDKLPSGGVQARPLRCS